MKEIMHHLDLDDQLPARLATRFQCLAVMMVYAE